MINSIIGLNSAINHWGILSLKGDFFQVSDYNMSNIQGFDAQSIRQLHADTLAPRISGPYLVHENKIPSSSEALYTFILSKPIVRLDLNQVCGYIVF